jgi:hypothetical protein
MAVAVVSRTAPMGQPTHRRSSAAADIMIEVQKGGRTTVPISNIMGFFVEGYDNSTKSVSGYLMTMPGKFVAGGGPTGPGGSFLIQIVLVR